MPRTQNATVALAACLFALTAMTAFQTWQINSTESKVIELKTEIKNLTLAQQKIADQLKKGVAVSGSTGGSGGGATSGTGYEASLNDPKNALKAPTDQLVASSGPEGGTLKRLFGSDPKGFNWLLENSVDVANLQALIHNTVARRDFNNPDNFVPDLAHKVEISDDNTEYTISIRKGVMWQTPPLPDIAEDKYAWLRKPHELKAEDFKFYIDMVLNTQVESGAARNYWADVDRVDIIDDYTYKIVWKKPTVQSLSTTMLSYPLPKWLFTKNPDGSEIPEATLGLEFNKHWANNYPIGTGPYRFVKYEKGKALQLVRNEDYWGEKPKITNIEGKIVKDPETWLRLIKKGDVDYSAMTATQYAKEILNDKESQFAKGDLKHEKYNAFGYRYIGWNAAKPMFADKRVRRALTQAFRRDEIIKNVYHGLGTLQTGPFVVGHSANNPAIKPWSYDLEAAKALLDEAGWKDTDGNGIRDKVIDGTKTELEFTITCYDSAPEWEAALSIFKEDLRNIGVAMDFSPVDWPTMQKKMSEKKFDAYTGGWGLAWAIDPYQLWHSSQAKEPKGSNYVNFQNKRADEIIETLRATFDNGKRTELLHEFHSILHEEQPYTFFMAPRSVVAYRPKLGNFQVQKIRPQVYSLPWYIQEGE